LAASFGVLKNGRMAFVPGLNIIQAPNEQGKSTWCAFIRAMLYGVNTAVRDKIGYLSEKTKYRPWSGVSMEGVMEVESEGQRIAIQRTALGATPMKRLDVRYVDAGQEVTALMREDLGEVLTGVSEEVFARSAFVRQSGLKVSQTGQLEQRIAALVSAGEEGVSYTDTANTLKSWLRKRRHNKTGQIPAIQAEIAALDQTKNRLEAASTAYNEISLDLERVVERSEELAADLQTHEELARRSDRQNIRDTRKKLQELDWEIVSLKKQLNKGDRQVTRELITGARENYDQFSVRTMQYAEEISVRDAQERDLQLMEEEKMISPFEGCDVETARETVEGAVAENLAAETAGNFGQQKYTISIGVLLVAVVGALAAFVMTGLPFYWVSIGGTVGIVVLGSLLYRKRSRAKRAQRKRDETFSHLRVADADALLRELEQYERLYGRSEDLKKAFFETDVVCEKIMAERDALRDSFEAAVRTFAPEVGDPAEALQAMGEVGRVMDRLEVVQRERDMTDTMLKSMTARYEGDPFAAIPQDDLKSPLRNKSETSYDLKRMEKELDALKNSYAMAKGELRVLGDPVVLGAKRGALTDRLAELTAQYEALELSISVLEEADGEMSARFSPLLAQRAGYYIDRLTDGAYKRLLFDKNLNPSAEQVGESVSRDILYLSGGTVDQIYLALRLAICDLTMPQERPCPLILDDALVAFDQTRLERALTLLKELAQTRQVILFTCHDREAEFFQDDGQVNIISN